MRSMFTFFTWAALALCPPAQQAAAGPRTVIGPTVAPAMAPTMDNTMHTIVQVASAEALSDALINGYTEFLYAGSEGVFEVQLAAGLYEGVSGNVVGPSRVAGSLRVVGTGTTPAVLRSSTLHLTGVHVELENLLIEGGRSSAPVLAVDIAHGLSLDRVALIDNDAQDLPAIPLVLVQPVLGTGDKTIRIQRSWLLSNHAHEPSLLVGWAPRSGDSVTDFLLEDVVLAGNDYAVWLEANAPLTCRRCLIAAQKGLALEAIFHVRSAAHPVRLYDSVLLMPGSAQLADLDLDEGVVRESTVTASGCRFLWNGDRPAWLALADNHFEPYPGKDLTGPLAQMVTSAQQGHAPDIRALGDLLTGD